MKLVEQLADVIAQLMRGDERRVLLGEDVSDGGMLGLSRRAIEDEALRGRIVATPLTPAAALAHAGGMALAGARPMVLLPSALPLVEGLAGLREVALLEWRTGGRHRAPVLFVAPTGPGFGLGGDATEASEATVARLLGVRVVTVGSAGEAPAMLRAAADFWAGEQPTLLTIPRRLLVAEVDDAAASLELARPFGSAHAVREGSAATVFAWGDTVGPALAAARRSGRDVAVIDVESLAPLSRDALAQAARATGKIVIAHAGPREHGIGAELAALFADEAILHLDAPITRVTGATGPLRATEEHRATPTVAEIAAAIEAVASH